MRIPGLVAAIGLAVTSDLSVDALKGLPDPCRDHLDRLTAGQPIGDLDPIILGEVARADRDLDEAHAASVDAELAKTVAGKLAKRWSPTQISRWLRRRYRRRRSWHVCTETIYEAVYRGLVVPAQRATLRTGRTYRHRTGRGRSRDGALRQLTVMRSIHDRPPAAQSRRQAGHWEGDLIVGAQQRSAVATLVERKTRFTVLVRLPGGHRAQHVGDALIEAFTALPLGLRRTLTWDQGNEMFQHARIEALTGLRVYFADPHAPWQRGSNENLNGLLRQYLPKGTDLRVCTGRQLAQIAEELNDRPRYVLGDRSPAQLMRRLGHQRITTAIRDDP